MMAAEAGASGNTLAAYRRDMEDFGRFVGGVGPAGAGASDAEGYMRSLAGAGLSARTGARRLSALRRFFRFLEAEVSALLAACGERPMARAALEVLYATGLRVSEVLSLRRGALRREAIVVRGKGGKERMVLL